MASGGSRNWIWGGEFPFRPWIRGGVVDEVPWIRGGGVVDRGFLARFRGGVVDELSVIRGGGSFRPDFQGKGSLSTLKTNVTRQIYFNFFKWCKKKIFFKPFGGGHGPLWPPPLDPPLDMALVIVLLAESESECMVLLEWFGTEPTSQNFLTYLYWFSRPCGTADNL